MHPEVCRLVEGAKAEVYTVVIILAIVLIATIQLRKLSFGSLNEPANLCRAKLYGLLKLLDSRLLD
jgi:hypothetical protein